MISYSGNYKNVDYYQSDIKTLRDEDSVYAMKYASRQMEIDKLKDERDKYKEIIEEVRALHKKFCTKHGIIVFENNELIEFMNNLIDTLNKAKGE